MAENIEVTKAVRHEFSRQEKVGYAVVVVTGILAVVFGTLYMGTHINAPFKITYTGNHLLNADQQQAAQISAQKKLDTDSDGVNDYDELNVYGTSPYLSDTDGDTIDDGTEISSGGDPTCVTGKICQNTINQVALPTPDIGPEPVAPADVDPVAALKASLLGAPIADIRALLIEAGAEQTDIDAMSDTDVLASYTDVIDQLEASGELAKIVAGAENSSGNPVTPTTP
jgi:hypothetical protein